MYGDRNNQKLRQDRELSEQDDRNEQAEERAASHRNLAAARRETHLTLSRSSTSSSPQRRCLRGLCALHIRIHRRSAP